MRKFRVVIETGLVDGDFVEFFEADDDATDAEIEETAKEIFFNRCSYGFSEVKDEEV